MRIRPATERDVPDLVRIKDQATSGPGWDHPAARVGWLEARPDPSEPDGAPGDPAIAHLIRTGAVVMATVGARVVGFASATRREDVWFLSQLFVGPSDQSAGAGARLLDTLLADDAASSARVRAVIASGDPRAFGLYLSRGLLPRWQMLEMAPRADATPGALPEPSVDQLGAADAAGLDALDRATRGFARPADHALFTAIGRGFALRDRGGLAGYLYVRDGGRCGPIAARDGRWFRRALDAALALAGETAWMPIPSADAVAVRHLLARGLRPRRSATFCADGALGPFRNCVLAGGMLP